LNLEGAVFFSEESIEDDAGIVQRGDRLSALAEGERAGTGRFTHPAIDGKTERAEAGFVAELGRKELVDGNRILEVPSFELSRGQEDVGGVMAANLAPVGMGKTAEDREVFAERFEALEAFVKLVVMAGLIGEPAPFRSGPRAASKPSRQKQIPSSHPKTL